MPSFPVDDITFKTRWEEACSNCSKVFMELLIGNNEKRLDKLDTDIEDTRRKQNENLTASEMDGLNKEIDGQFSIWEKEIKETKAKKFQRDLQDYKSGTVYRWQSTTSKPSNLSRSSSMSSLSSREGEETQNQIYNLRKNNYRRRNDTPRRFGRNNGGASTSKLQVINLSNYELTNAQQEVLSLGLSFSPTSSFNSFLAINDLQLFACKLVLKKLHDRPTGEDWMDADLQTIAILEELEGEQQTDHGVDAGNLKFYPPIPKTFPPLNLYPDRKMFVKLVTREFEKIETSTIRHSLSGVHRAALKELKNLKGVLIKPADKGGNVVVWPIHIYEREAFRQLRDETCYKRLTFNPTSKFQQELQNILDEAFYNGLISKELQNHLIPRHPRMACIYFTPKIHKNPNIPPGRPIVSGNGNLCETIFKFLDFHLKPLVFDLPSYAKDTSDVLRKIEGIPWDEDMWLVSMDVESLYTSIYHQDGIQAVRTFLTMTEHDPDFVEFLLILLTFALEHNFFIFKETIYLQKQGTAMGAAFASSYANLFLGMWERGLFFTKPVAYIEGVLFWTRYIDDILFIWQGSERDLLEFVKILNDNNLNIRLTVKYSQTTIDFLDIQISGTVGKTLETDVFRKKTAVNNLLHASSSHPKPLV
ncbi:unnamed protein product [Ranitomeya imitator]|uniref:Reverse transcriptase domain-containing protein n=1 Tax=Ranitomeya imitator TaxID=111125 RepID=A0ABN9MPE7_9NEOB|nr:unnamed protein product [Ranitomeya imitator]